MSSGFIKVRFHVAEKEDKELRSIGMRGLSQRSLGRASKFDDRSVSFNNDEAAARFYLGKVLHQDARSGVRAMSAPDRAEAVPDFQTARTQATPLTRTRLVQFQQTRHSIPIFGSRVNVELDENRELVGVTGQVADFKNVSAVPALSPQDAVKKIEELTGSAPGSLAQKTQLPELTFFHRDEDDSWHLAYFLKKVPAAPEKFLESAWKSKSQGHGLGMSPRKRHPLLNYLVDAHDGTVLFYYSAVPLMAIPVKCRGLDEAGVNCDFWGCGGAGAFQMNDPLRFIKTYDHKLRDLEGDPLPADPVQSAKADWGGSNKACVSAHMSATRVYDFYKSVLMRDGIDDKAMDLVSIANCTYAADEAPPEWHNAMWYDNRMWYGQSKDSAGNLRSFSRFLDVIAHELTHGITEYTSNLVYQGQSGALNESFSDIFGVIINNWYRVGPDSDVGQWNWELGAGLGQGGLPLRDMSDPKKTGDPDHMDDYLQTPFDNGGVHTNSNIHNKAAYNVLTVQDDQGECVFTPRDVAVLYYLCLIRLGSLATFVDVLGELVDVAAVYYAGDDAERQRKIAAIRNAYARVGIQ
jgi:bacillolysin